MLQPMQPMTARLKNSLLIPQLQPLLLSQARQLMDPIGAGQPVVVLIQMSEDVTVDTTLGSPTL